MSKCVHCSENIEKPYITLVNIENPTKKLAIHQICFEKYFHIEPIKKTSPYPIQFGLDSKRKITFEKVENEQ